MMNDTNSNTPTWLRIWQQNLNTSFTAQHSLINCMMPNDYDILAIQEPHINFLSNTISNHHYHVLYPSTHPIQPTVKTQAITLVSTKLDSNAWKQLPFPSPDVIVLQLNGNFGTCTIFNIYNDCKHNDTLQTLGEYLNSSLQLIRSTTHDHVIWLGDFNHHHPLWEEECNNHLLTNQHLDHAEPLLELIADHGMVMALPKDTPRLEALTSKSWTHPDNVFCTETTTNAIVHCFTDPSKQGPCTDHVPILTLLKLQIPNTDIRPSRNFNKTLKASLTPLSITDPIVTEDQFQHTAKEFTDAIIHTINEHIPFSHLSPHSKCWWTKELSLM